MKKSLDKAREVLMRNKIYVNPGPKPIEVVNTPSLMLDYKLGIGGFPYGHGVEVFGANRIGKSSAIAYGVMGNVIRQGKLPILVASEPRLVSEEDVAWCHQLGFDPEQSISTHPDNIEEAFESLRNLVYDNLCDYIVIDSLAGFTTRSSATRDGSKKAFGISGEVADGLAAIMNRAWRNNIGMLIINQQRQGTSGQPGISIFDSPGGEALKHHMRIRIHVRPGKDRFMAKIEGHKQLVGRQIVCSMIKNNMSKGQEKQATFNFFFIDTDQYGPVGIDKTQDVIDVGMLTRVIDRRGAYYFSEVFPDGKLQGKESVNEFLRANPDAYEPIRTKVMDMMKKREKEAAVVEEDDEA